MNDASKEIIFNRIFDANDASHRSEFKNILREVVSLHYSESVSLCPTAHSNEYSIMTYLLHSPIKRFCGRHILHLESSFRVVKVSGESHKVFGITVEDSSDDIVSDDPSANQIL